MSHILTASERTALSDAGVRGRRSAMIGEALEEIGLSAGGRGAQVSLRRY
jgi:hypothetical protein